MKDYIKIYCGGPFEFQYKDYSIENLSKDYRAALVGNPKNIAHENSSVPTTFASNLRVQYVGPFYFYEDQKTAEDIVSSEMSKVETANIVFFYLPINSNCPGTITELVYAATLRKKIVIAYERQSNTGEPENNIDHPLWYPLLFADWNNAINMVGKRVTNKEEAIKFFNEYLRQL